MVDWRDIVGNVLLFFLAFGMSATVDMRSLMAQLKNKKAIATGIFLQFVILPLIGFIIVRCLSLEYAVGITLLILTTSPGGSFSNWWCSVFNADLALSVTMTAISTLLSVVLLPLSLLLYTGLSYEGEITEVLDWWALFTSLAVVIFGIGLGLFASEKFDSKRFHLNANRVGSLCGLALAIFSAVLTNTSANYQLWDRDWQFYVGVAAPCLFGLIIANIMTTLLKLKEPERVTVSIECCYQNVGIATSMALTMFDGEDLPAALGVPFYYGLVEAVLLSIYCIGAWKLGWSKAPKDVSIWTAIATSYEVLALDDDDFEKVDATELTEKATGTPTNKEDDEEAFHYVQHSDLEDAAADKE